MCDFHCSLAVCNGGPGCPECGNPFGASAQHHSPLRLVQPRPKRTGRAIIQHVIAAGLSAAVTLLALVAVAHCEESRPSVAKPLSIYSLSIGADLASTALAESRGAVELNPLLKNKPVRYALSVGAVAALTAIDHDLQRHGKRGRARALRLLVMGVRTYAVVRNLRHAL